MKTHPAFVAIVIFVAVAIAVSSSPLLRGNDVTGAVPVVVPKSGTPSVGTPVVTVDEVKPGFWERVIVGIFGSLNVTEPETTPDEPACCADAKTQELEDRINELQDRLAEVEEVQNRPCSSVTISSGTCTTACTNQGLKCTGALTVRWKSDELLFGGREESIIRTETASCDYDWYMAFPEVFDRRQCFCC